MPLCVHDGDNIETDEAVGPSRLCSNDNSRSFS